MSYPIPKQAGTIRKYRSIQKRAKTLYDVNRLRYDDVIKQLMEEYFIMSSDTISRILNTEVPDSDVDPNQMGMFDEKES